jgi:hypothetical protein
VATEMGVPSFAVLTDSTLRDIAERRPGTREELARTRGVGPRALAKFGDALLAMVCRTAPIQLALLLSACMSWHPEPASPAELIATQRPDVVRITQSDSSRLILRDPAVQGDTLYGRPQASLDDEPQGRTAIPLGDIRGIATRQSDPTRTTLLGAGIVVTTVSVLCLGADAFGCGSEDIFANASGSR